MAENALNVEIRQAVGKGVARRLRAAGRIPAICYGQETKTVALSLDPRALRQLIERSDTGRNTIIRLEGASEVAGTQVLVRELQREPVRGAYLHADFYAIDIRETVEVEVPIHLVGKPKGVEFEGGVLDHSLRELELECLPLAIPKEIVVDVSELSIGDSLHVRDLALPEGVELRSDPNLSVVSVVAPSKTEAEVPVAAEGVVEPGEAGEVAAAAPEAEAGGDESED